MSYRTYGNTGSLDENYKESNNKNYGQKKKDNKLWLLEDFKNLTEKKLFHAKTPIVYSFKLTSSHCQKFTIFRLPLYATESQVFPVFITGIQMMRGQLT
jgi:hypothetical protein